MQNGSYARVWTLFEGARSRNESLESIETKVLCRSFFRSRKPMDYFAQLDRDGDGRLTDEVAGLEQSDSRGRLSHQLNQGHVRPMF